MSSKRDRMRQKARKELRKKGIEPSKPKIEGTKDEDDDPPSLFSGFWMTFLGFSAMSIFVGLGQELLGIIAGAPFVIIGAVRIFKSGAARGKKASLSD